MQILSTVAKKRCFLSRSTNKYEISWILTFSQVVDDTDWEPHANESFKAAVDLVGKDWMINGDTGFENLLNRLMFDQHEDLFEK